MLYQWHFAVGQYLQSVEVNNIQSVHLNPVIYASSDNTNMIDYILLYQLKEFEMQDKNDKGVFFLLDLMQLMLLHHKLQNTMFH